MKVLRKYVNESNSVGNRLESRVIEHDTHYSIQFIVNDVVKTEAKFDKNQSLDIVDQHARDWLKEVRSLNG